MSGYRLKQSASPYLHQHSDNPIEWYQWSDDAFATAVAQDRPIFLSIGYSSCHWCHVMEGDSFKHDDVAAILNKYFISIKVDREERPDVDTIYMDAAHAMGVRGGWPLSVCLTPQRLPFWAATFVPRADFKRVLQAIAQEWEGEGRAKLNGYANAVSAHLTAKAPTSPAMSKADFANATVLAIETNYQQLLLKSFDRVHGGFGGAPKFPPHICLHAVSLLLRKPNHQPLEHLAAFTFEQMARGGICDQAGGGIHRYATESDWFAPHFEKMLYDNALLSSALARYVADHPSAELQRMLVRMLDYLLRDMQDSEGGFYCAEDADSEHCEGKFYLWRYDELKTVLTPQELDWCVTHLNVTAEGNFEPPASSAVYERAAGMHEVEGGNILHLRAEARVDLETLATLDRVMATLATARASRIRPFKDTKVLCSWNALAISACVDGFRTTSDPRYRDAALAAWEFTRRYFMKAPEQLLRCYFAGRVHGNAQLDDYAYLIRALLDLQSISAENYVSIALQLQHAVDKFFWDEGSYFDAPEGDPNLISRSQTLHDQAIPSANAVCWQNLSVLASLTGNPLLKNRATTLAAKLQPLLTSYPQASGSAIIAAQYLRGVTLVTVWPSTTTDHTDFAQIPLYQELLKRSLSYPVQLLHVATLERGQDILDIARDKSAINGMPTFYVCGWGNCQKPTNKLEEAFEQITHT